jgi:hypothetical protein
MTAPTIDDIGHAPDSDSPEPETPAEGPERPCDLCAESGTTDALPVHGECIIRREFGGIAHVLIPEDVADGTTDVDGGMTFRQSGLAVELCMAKTTADAILRAPRQGDGLDERRKVLAVLRAMVCDDLTELERLDPAMARAHRIKELLGDLAKAVCDQLDDDDE